VLCVAAMVPMIHLAWLVRHYGVDVPILDDWEMAPLIVKAHTGQLEFSDLYEQQQEARTLLPKLIFVLSAARGPWNVRDQILLSLISCALTTAGIFFLLYRSGLSLGAIAICFWLMVLTIFSLAQFELWIFASGFPSFFPALFLIAAWVTLNTRLSTLAKFLICAALATASSFTLSHGLLAWGLTFPAFLLAVKVPRWRSWLAGWLALSAVCAAAYFWGYQKPAYLPVFAPATSPIQYGRFILEFLGGGLAYSSKDRPATAAAIFGVVQLALFLAALIYTVQHRHDHAFPAKVIPWFVLGLSAVASALLAALGRIQYGADYALASRYVTFSLWLTVAVIALVAIIGDEIVRAQGSIRSRAWLTATCFILIAAYLIPYRVSAANTRFFLRALSAKYRLSHGAILFSPVIDTSEVISKTSYPGDGGTAIRRAAALDNLRLLRPPLLRTNRLSALPHEAGGRDAVGACQTLAPADGESLRAAGWAVLRAKGRPPDCVAAAYRASPNQEWSVFAISDSFEMRAEVVKRFRSMEQLWSGWSITFPKNAIPPGAQLSFWAVDADQPRLYELADDSSHNTR
jgi:hypothetical protein